MAKVSPVWALDIGQAALKALKLAPAADADHVTAEAFDYVEYPKILSQPDADPETLVREALQTFLDRNDLKGCRVAIGVAGQAGLVKFIKLPPVEKKRIPDIVKFEARQQIPFALEEVIWDYQQIGGDDDGDEGFAMAEVGLFAMKRDQIGRAIYPLQAAGIEVDVVQMGPIALYNFAAFDALKPEDKEKGSVVLIDIGADNTDLIITDGARIWQRNVPIGGNHFTRALTKELKLTFAKAEHLKRNATKAPDPRAVFTAMRGVFNDFASEVNRSIGFYSSVNRTAKISRVVGLGNGFKLPGLQKFLQQNLTYEVDKLESFDKIVGDEVKGAPQFQENLPSFAVAYGLGLQGLGRARLRTNLLPPEVERVRMLRRKKPWAAAAAALITVGVLARFAGDYRAYAKVNTPDYNAAISQAKSAKAEGDKLKSGFDSAKGQFQTTKDDGEALIPVGDGPNSMADFLKTLQEYLVFDPTIDPRDPTGQTKLDPDVPDQRRIIDRLRVHIDAIRPVWESDLGKWYDDLSDPAKNVMHPYDRDPAHKPTGEGWIVQIVGHHFNPSEHGGGKNADLPVKGVDYGPLTFLNKVVLPRLSSPRFRAFGFNHPTYTWVNIDKTWVGDRETPGGNRLASNAPILARNITPPAGESGAGGGIGMMGSLARGGMGSMGGMGGMGGGLAMPPPAGMAGMGGMMADLARGGGPGAGGPGMMMGRMPGMAGMPGGAGQPEPQTRTRTDFKIEMLWTPPTDAKSQPQTKSEMDEAVAKIWTDMQESAKNVRGVVNPPDENAFAKVSTEATAKALKDVEATLPTAPADGQVPAAATPAATTVPTAVPAGSGATPAVPGAAPAMPGAPPSR